MRRRPRRKLTIPSTASAQETNADKTSLDHPESFASAVESEHHAQPAFDHVLNVLDQLRRMLKHLETKRQLGGLRK